MSEQELRELRMKASIEVAKARLGTSHHKLASALKRYEKAKESHEQARKSDKK